MTSFGEDAIRPLLQIARSRLLEAWGPTPYPLWRGELAGAGREGGRVEAEEGGSSQSLRGEGMRGCFVLTGELADPNRSRAR
jgi:hypothetical protein